MSFARVRALVVVGVLTLSALVFVIITIVKDTQSGDPVAAGCPEGFKRANITLREPKDVKIRVLNATKTPGLANSVASDFANRKFQVVKASNNNKTVDGVAVLRYGPKAVGSFHLLRAYFLNAAEPEYDADREDDVVDVVIGTSFQQLATTTEVNQALVELGGRPELPPQTCAEEE